MNKVPIIRKGVYKDYRKPAINGGMFFAVATLLFSVANNNIWISFAYAFGVWAFIIFIFGIGFLGEEYFNRKKRIKYLHSPLFDFLHQQQFTLSEDFVFTGTYKDYRFTILPIRHPIRVSKNRIKHFELIHIITPYTFPENITNPEQREHDLTDIYHMGHVIFSNGVAELVLKDLNDVNFKECFDGLIHLLKREGLKPAFQTEREERKDIIV